MDNRQDYESDLPHLLDIPALAEHLGITERHVRWLIAERRIPFVKVGRLVRFDPGDVAEWLNSSRLAADRHPA